jgi:hypothetical protein
MANAKSADLKVVLKRVKGSDLPAGDKAILSDMLAQTIKLRQLVEKSTVARGNKKVLASLPFGFDIVK